MIFRAPASTANLGPGFDCAAAALDLWNELELEQGDGTPPDPDHLGVRAFAKVASPEGWSFAFSDHIPRERGLGSSASIVALGLVAAAAVSGNGHSADELLALGTELEGHADNLAAVLLGGVCMAWRRDGRPYAQRIATDMPAAAVLAVPGTRTGTAESRNGLPFTVKHEDAAATAGAAALLGAAIVAGDADLLRDAFKDRLHEPYRLEGAPLLRELRAHAPAGTVGVTLSGSGPSVVVWADKRRAGEVAAALEHSLPADTRVLPLGIAPEGARAE